jgi:putative transposase
MSMHSGQAGQISRQRQEVLSEFHHRHPERFVKGVPLPPKVPEAAWINTPEEKSDAA